MGMFTLGELEDAAAVVHSRMPPTPQYSWPLLNEAVGAEVWVKHENHTPTGSFKLRGAVTYIDWLRRTQPDKTGICTATRGNHGQGQTREALAAGMTSKIYVPHGNSTEKNAAMRGFGAELVEFGEDFDVAKDEAMRVARAENLATVPPFHRELVRGVATYGYEFFKAVPDLHTVYVPIGCGSGICGVISARDALGLNTRIVGVVSERAMTAKLSYEAGHLVDTNSCNTFIDGISVRVSVQDALDVYGPGADRIVSISDDEAAEAIRLLFRATHNTAEPAGAAALAALIQEKDAMSGKKVGVILTGGNIDADWFAKVLSGGTPEPR